MNLLLWLALAIADQLPPPDTRLIELLKDVPKPNFSIKPVPENFRPLEPQDSEPLKPPDISDNATPQKEMKVPKPPNQEKDTPKTVAPPPLPPGISPSSRA